jgi:serine protease Do
MGLFDDDFYSTRVSRKARSSSGKDEWGFRRRSGAGWGPVPIAFASSIVSALGAVLLFGMIFGFGGGAGSGGNGAGGTELAPVQTVDTAERIIQASAKVRPAVVSIINEQMLPAGGFWEEPDAGDGSEDGLEPEEENTLQQVSVGSGVIFDKVDGKARIITNYHVVDGADALKAMLVSGEIREAKVIGKDQITDLAVLEVDGAGIDTVVEIGDSSKLRDGETVIAIGNPLGLGDSLTMGIISKSHRVIPVSLNQDGVYDWEQEVIQIDASINQGNSGGALVNLNGQVIGINSMKVADYGVEGLGFAIPMHNAMPVIDELVEHGKVMRPYLGVYTLDLDQYMFQQAMPELGGDTAGDEEADGEADAETAENELKLPASVKQGVIVLEAVGPAKEAGLKFNDVIVKLDNQPVGSTMELRKYLYSNKQIGDTIEVSYYRGGELEKLSFKLAEKADEE